KDRLRARSLSSNVPERGADSKKRFLHLFQEVTSSPGARLWLERAADVSLDLIDGVQVGAERLQMSQRRLSIAALSVEKVEQALAAAAVGVLHGVAGLGRLGQIVVAQRHDAIALDERGLAIGVERGQHLERGGFAHCVHPGDLGLSALDLTLVAIE